MGLRRVDSLLNHTNNPLVQAALVLSLALLTMLIAKVVNWSGILAVDVRFPWQVSAAFMLFYALFSSVFCLSTKNMNWYWQRSMLGFIGLAALSAGLAYAFSNLRLSEAGSYRWIYIAVTIAYLVFMSIVAFMRQVISFAQREDNRLDEDK